MMEIRDILVLLDGEAASEKRLDAAFRAAATFQASVTGLFVGLFPVIPSFVRAQLPKTLKQEQWDEARAIAAKVQKRFWARAGSRRGEHEWKVAIGDFPDILRLVTGYARFADLTVVSRSQDELRDGVIGVGVAEEIVLSSGAPVLLVPGDCEISDLGKRILIGWNGSREAARAVHDSLPFLKAAEEVTLLTVETGTAAPAPMDAGGDIVRHLSHHGVDASVRQSLVSGTDVGDVILSRAADTGADMIVMGAYGHSRLRELALGGATRRVITRAQIPVLMSH